VVEYFQGRIGLPPFGFPEPLRSKVLHGTTETVMMEESNGLPAYDFEETRAALEKKWGNDSDGAIRTVDILSHAIYPAVFDDYQKHKSEFGPLHYLNTRAFLTGMEVGQELCVDIEHGKRLVVRLVSVSAPDENGKVTCFFELNGAPRQILVQDELVSATVVSHAKANTAVTGSVGAPMPGVVVDTKVDKGAIVHKGDPLVTLNGMKMEVTVVAPVDGVVTLLDVHEGEQVQVGDLLVEIVV